jgi:hypothetical protein
VSIKDYRQGIENKPARVYLVQMLNTGWLACESPIKCMTYSEISAAFPSTVRRTVMYSVVPQNQCPVSRPFACFRSPHHKIIEKPKVI